MSALRPTPASAVTVLWEGLISILVLYLEVLMRRAFEVGLGQENLGIVWEKELTSLILRLDLVAMAMAARRSCSEVG